MTFDHRERLRPHVGLFDKPGVAQARSATGKKGIRHRRIMTKLRQRMNAQKLSEDVRDS